MNSRAAWVLGGLLALACEAPPRDGQLTTESSTPSNETVPVELAQEEYVMVTTAATLPLYVNHDQAAFRAWGEKRGVRVSILGPSEWDIPGQIQTLEQVIGTRPAGLLVNGTDPGIAQAINRAVEAGIPTVVYDSDVPSKRHAFLGTDWYEVGKLQGERMVKLLGGRGKVACLGILGMSNQEAGFRGFQDVIARYPGIEFLGTFEDGSNLERATRVAADLLAAHPDLAGFAGFTDPTAPGVALAVREAGRAGKVVITGMNTERPQLELVRTGVVHLLVGQKRELFTWYGAQFLHDLAHRQNQLSHDDRRAGVAMVPDFVNPGLFVVDRSNVEQFLRKQ
jgi:ABC-type sugar transport system substrate-binding protein